MSALYTRTVHYYETDKMNCVHHSNYIRWFEEARTFLMEQMGFGYDKMEALNIVSPVLHAEAEYRSMTRFGETVEVEAEILKYTGVKLWFSYTVRDKATKAIRCTGKTEHCFLNERGKPILLRRVRPELDARIRAAADADASAGGHLPSEGKCWNGTL